MEENLSYLNPREPSLFFRKWTYEAARTNLLSRLEEGSEEKTGNIKVYLRIKPVKQLLGPPQDEAFKVTDSETLAAKTSKDAVIHEFKFTKIYNEKSTQEQIFNESILSLVSNFVNGENCLLFAYGTSSAGKTYTIQGTAQEPGVLPRAINVVFNSIHGRESHTCKLKPDLVSKVLILDEQLVKQELAFKQKIMSWSSDKIHGNEHSQSSKSTLSQVSDISLERKLEHGCSSLDSQDMAFNTFQEMQLRLNDAKVSILGESKTVFSAWVSFAEIYNENVYDLLEPIAPKGQRRPNLALGQENNGQVYIKGLRHVWVTSGEEAFQVMLYGKHNLKFAPTALNSVSSRSHCIFTIKLLQFVNTENPQFARISMFSFCDLAGAERLKNTQNVGERLRESQNINTSLHVLGRCLMTMRDNQYHKNKRLIPFRDSKLTRLFQRALNGKESIVMIVNVNPMPLLREETFNVLTFSAIAKQIVLQPHRQNKRVPRSSRFSQYVSLQSNTIRGDETHLTTSSIDEKDALQRQIETLSALVERQKAELEVQRKERQNAETKIRHELCDHFNKMMVEAQAAFETQLENTQLRYEQMTDWKVSRLQEYIHKQQSRKRQREDDDDDDEDLNSTKVTNEEVDHLKQRLSIANELTQLAKNEQSELQKECSKLTLELSQCQTALKNSEKLRIAAEKSATEGNGDTLSLELQTQLQNLKAELDKKEAENQDLKGILEDAEKDYKHLESECSEYEQERNALVTKVAEMELEKKQMEAAVKDRQQVIERQVKKLDEKDEIIEQLQTELEQKCRYQQRSEKQYQEEIEVLKSKLKELKEDCRLLKNDWNDCEQERNALETNVAEMELEKKILQATLIDRQQVMEQQVKKLEEMDEIIKKLQTESEQESEIDVHQVLKEKQKLLDQQSELIDEKEGCIKKLEKQLEKESLKVQELEVYQKEIQILKDVNDNLMDKLHRVEKAEKDVLKRMIKAQNALDDQRKHSEEREMSLQTENSELKVELQSYKDTAELVRSMKEEMESKYLKLEELESQNEQLNKQLGEKELEMARFNEHREEIAKKYEDLLRKEREECEKHKREVTAYQQMFNKNTPTPKKLEYEAKILKMEKDMKTMCEQYFSLKEQHSKCQTEERNPKSASKESRTSCRKSRRKAAKENDYPTFEASASQEKRYTRQGTKEQAEGEQRYKTRNRRKKLFTENNDSQELNPVEIDSIGASKPERIVRLQRM